MQLPNWFGTDVCLQRLKLAARIVLELRVLKPALEAALSGLPFSYFTKVLWRRPLEYNTSTLVGSMSWLQRCQHGFANICVCAMATVVGERYKQACEDAKFASGKAPSPC